MLLENFLVLPTTQLHMPGDGYVGLITKRVPEMNCGVGILHIKPVMVKNVEMEAVVPSPERVATCVPVM